MLLTSRVLLHKRSSQKLGGRIAVIVLLNLVVPSSLAQTAGLPHGWESYNDRPDILTKSYYLRIYKVMTFHCSTEFFCVSAGNLEAI